jgi:small-conductance mechanosensitive channel/CRP-like cAMP-binding protein
LVLTGGIVPYRPEAMTGGEPTRLFVEALETVWWLSAASVAVGFLRAFVTLGRRPHERKLVQDLAAAVIYLAAILAIAGYVFDLPLKGLLATSGVAAIVLGLALQSSLGDVFSGIMLNIERPYRVGDWIVLDDTAQGRVLETNWRATHILTPKQDVAIIPNSIIAKSKLVNRSTPTQIHESSIRVKIEPSLPPAAGRELLREVLLGSATILRTPEPNVTIWDISAEAIDYELSFSVAETDALDLARNDVFDGVHWAVAAAGAKFSPRLADNQAVPTDNTPLSGPECLLSGISLFSTLTTDEKAMLASQMERKEYKPGEVIVKSCAASQALSIVSRGVLVVSTDEGGRRVEISRLTGGTYFGEIGIHSDEALNAEISALTRVVIYEISADALSPFLKARPNMVDELIENLANRRFARRTVLDGDHDEKPHGKRTAEQVAAGIRRLFSIV